MKFFFIFLLVFINEYQLIRSSTDIVTDQVSGAPCGKPGHSKLNNFTPVKRIYRNNEIVEYLCENSMILIGPQYRTCQDGKWSKSIPKCASRLPKTAVNYINANVLVISVQKPSRISAVSITLFARKTSLSISKIKYLPEYNCTKSVITDQDAAFLPFTINFLCKSSLIKKSQYVEGNFIVVNFNIDISCDLDCSYKLKKDENVDMYEINEDNCGKPDFPLYGHSKRWPLERVANAKSMNLNKTVSSTTLKPVILKNNSSNLSSNKTIFYNNTKIITNKNSSALKSSNKTTNLFDKKSTTTTTMTTTTESATSQLTTFTTEPSNKLPSHFYDTISSDVTSSNETITENSIFSSTTTTASTHNQITNSNETKKVEIIRQKYYCNQHFKMNTNQENDNFDEVMARSRYSIKHFEICQDNEDWQYVKLPECIPEIFCRIPTVPDNVVPNFSNLYLNEYSVVHEEISYKCLNDEDVNIGGSLQTCLISSKWSGLAPKCVTKNLGLTTNNTGIIYVSISVSIISLFILMFGIYCAFKLNKTVQVFNEQHQLVQQNLSTQSSLNSNNLPDYNNPALIYNNSQGSRELPKVPSFFSENIYDSVQNEPRYVDFYSIDRNQKLKQKQSTWNSLKRKLSKQDLDDPNNPSYRRVNTDSCEYDYVDLNNGTDNNLIYKNILDNQTIQNIKKESTTFKTNT